ncbi:2-oxo-tetronate isomerase [Rhodoferax sp.]|uniref:2-oxo-tetronate isomerase n=1 Tax=Rhodoferax sp. TaxID=50421 RepID=UPI00374D1AD9
MPKFAANLSMLYTELPFMERFAACARDGFKGVEILFPYDMPATDIAQALQANGLEAVLFNTPPGDLANGDRGLAGQPGREAEFRAAIDSALQVALATGCKRIHVMSGLGESLAPRLDLLCANLAYAAAQFQPHGITALIEPINTRDIPGYLLNTQAQAHAIVDRVGAANLRVQMDLYHCQIVEGDVAMKICKYLPLGSVGHFQIAGVPERHEPDIGELDYTYLFGVIDEVSAQCGWDGWVGCEYRPLRGAQSGGTSAGLGWLQPWR